jgi:hypothetical protein
VAYPYFLPRCEQTLPRAQAAAVRRLMVSTAKRVKKWLQDRTDHELTRAEVLDLIATVSEGRTKSGELQAVLAATQVVLARGHYSVRLDVGRLLLSRYLHTSTIAHDSADWDRLRRYPKPNLGCVCALISSGISREEIRAVTIADVEPDGRTVRMPDRTVQINKASAQYVCAQRLHRRLAGYSEDQLLVAGRQEGGAMSVQYMGLILNNVRRECGLVFAEPPGSPRHVKQLGITLERLI